MKDVYSILCSEQWFNKGQQAIFFYTSWKLAEFLSSNVIIVLKKVHALKKENEKNRFDFYCNSFIKKKQELSHTLICLKRLHDSLKYYISFSVCLHPRLLVSFCSGSFCSRLESMYICGSDSVFSFLIIILIM